MMYIRVNGHVNFMYVVIITYCHMEIIASNLHSNGVPPFSFEVTIHRWGIWLSYAPIKPGIWMSITLNYVAFISLNYPQPYKYHPDSYSLKTQEGTYDARY